MTEFGIRLTKIILVFDGALIEFAIDILTQLCESPGLVVMGGYSWSDGRGFEFQH